MLDPTSPMALYAWLSVGLGTVALALGGFFFPSRKARFFQVLPILLAALAAVGAGGVALAGQMPLALPLVYVTALFLVVGLLRTGAVRSVGLFLVDAVSRSRVQYAGLLLAGGAVLCWQSYQITGMLQGELDETERHINMILTAAILEPYPLGMARTDTGGQIPLWRPVADENSDDQRARTFLRNERMEIKLIQTDSADHTYNCHGWIFAGGKAWIRGGSVDQILREHRYKEVSQPSPGDIAVYRDQFNVVMHTALVRGYTQNGIVLLESKWGKLGRYVHTAHQHSYAHYNCTYYTTLRGSHLLRGIEP